MTIDETAGGITDRNDWLVRLTGSGQFTGFRGTVGVRTNRKTWEG